MSQTLLAALGADALLPPPQSPPIFMIVEPVDMRLGIEGLSALVQTRLAQSPCSGGLYLFSNARRNRLKLLLWDATGVWLAQRRLHQGRFSWVSADALNASNAANTSNAGSTTSYTLSAERWQALVCGVDWTRLFTEATTHTHWRCA